MQANANLVPSLGDLGPMSGSTLAQYTGTKVHLREQALPTFPLFFSEEIPERSLYLSLFSSLTPHLIFGTMTLMDSGIFLN